MGQCKSKAAAAADKKQEDYVFYDNLSLEKQHQVQNNYLVMLANCPLNLFISNGDYHMAGYIFGTETGTDCCTTVLTPLQLILSLFETSMYRPELFTVTHTDLYPKRYQYKSAQYKLTGMLAITAKEKQ